VTSRAAQGLRILTAHFLYICEYFVRVLRLNRKGVIEMFSSDFFWSQVWKMMLGAVVCIIGIIIYTVLQFVDLAIVCVHKFAAYWPLRALLLVVVLWGIGQLIYWLRGWGSDDTPVQTDNE
jgi:hypothetical protein